MKIGIIFGAGAERTFGLSGGKDFSKKVLGLNEEKMNDAVEKYHKNKELDNWYPSYCKHTWEKDKLLKAALRKKYLEESKNYKTKQEFKDIINEQYDQIIQRSEKEQDKLIDRYTSYIGILDEKFHTLISPRELGPANFWKVIDAYTRAYLALTENMISDDISQHSNKYFWILNNPKKANEYINKFCKEMSTIDSYYKIIKECDKKDDFRIITTNYTPLIDIITDINNIAHLHGKLNWFESPREWKVYDVLNDELPNKELLFPYIFVQSGVKPIVEEKILMEYSKAIEYLHEVEKLIIVGYRLNFDDNHINGLIRNYILDGNSVIYLDFDNESRIDILNRLCITQNFEKIDFKILSINNDNSLSVFKDSIDFDHNKR